MKKVHIIAIILIAVLVGVLISMLGDFSRYESFGSDYALKGREINVVGTLAKGKALSYDPQKDPNHFSFYMVDEKGVEKKIVYKGAKPRDIERAEKVVITGKIENDEFHASKILMKCPSKYVQKEVQQTAAVKQ
jgi:cytochrome c-type biogenesis protein CcmE